MGGGKRDREERIYGLEEEGTHTHTHSYIDTFFKEFSSAVLCKRDGCSVFGIITLEDELQRKKENKKVEGQTAVDVVSYTLGGKLFFKKRRNAVKRSR